MPFLVAIDGPAGAGKSTVARRIARKLGYTYLDTGAMYRSVAWKALQSDIAAEDADRLEAVARALAIRFSALREDSTQQVWLDGEDVTAAIRTPEVSSFTSRISVLPSVRAVVVDQQRRIAEAEARGVVLEGRDIGTVVFPNAPLKIFLTASPEERARRRVEEMQSRGLRVDADRTLAELLERDARDSHRETSPLAMADDAVPIHTDGLTIDEVVQRILALREERRS
jgi:cytidylate kinase